MTAGQGLSLSIQDLETGYGATRALNRLSLSIARGEIVALVGSNGVGKTTTLRAIMGQLPVWSGSIALGDRDLTRAPTHRRVREGVSLVPEGRQIFKELTAAENILLGAYSRQDRREVSADFERLLDLFAPLQQRLHSLGGQLSGGEQQMVALARALMSKPALLLLDEPSLGLAPKIVEGVFDLIPKIREQGISLLVVEQNARRALEISDRGYVMSRGTVALSGPSADLLTDQTVRSIYLGFRQNGDAQADQADPG